MTTSKYEIVKIEDDCQECWHEFVAKSPQYTPFMRDDFLRAIRYKSDKYLMMKNGVPVLGVCLPISEDGTQGVVPYAPYHGILQRSAVDSHTFYKENLEAASALLELLDCQYDSIFFSNHYSVVDMRPFLWHHYHTPEQGLYKIDLRYTAIKDLSRDVMEHISKGRKLDYRYSTERWKLTIDKRCNEQQIIAFLNLYRETFARQGIEMSIDNLRIIREILYTAINNEYGIMRSAVEPGGRMIDSIFVISDNHTAYYLFAANHPTYRKYGGGTLLLLETMRELQQKGIKTFDFVGANSPLRGDFKLSFGAVLKPYYVCKMDKCSGGGDNRLP